jgi:hypothetical protein
VKNRLVKLTKHHKNEAFKSSRFSRANIVVFAIIFAAIGGYFIYSSFAAGPVVSVEVENGSVISPGSVINDASASGGKAVHLGASAACSTTADDVIDGVDPWGGCFPGPNNTGVPAGITLTNYTGSCTITTNNATIDSKTINCAPLNIQASGVQITRSKVNGSINNASDAWPNPYSFTVSDTEIDAGPLNQSVNDGPHSIGKSNFTATRVETHGGAKGVWCEYNCTVQDSWIHGQATDIGGHAHESGIRPGSGPAGQGQFITHNSIGCDGQDVAPDAGCSADISGYGDFNYIQYNTFSHNLLLPPADGVCAYGGSTSPKPYLPANHDVWTDNIFQRGTKPSQNGFFVCGYYGVIADFDINSPGNVWTNNRFDDGTTPGNGTLIPSTNVQF